MEVTFDATQPITALTHAGPADVGTQDTFLKLLVAQLEHQDPLSPMENIEFTGQLAQFRTLEQIEAMNASLNTLANLQGGTARVQAVDYIGREIRAEGNAFRVSSGEASPLQYELAAGSASASVSIIDEQGLLVQTLDLAAQPAGEQVVRWDGRDASGNTVPDGTYRFSVTAQDQSGDAVPVRTRIQGVVEGVEMEGNTPFLLVGGNRVGLASLISVHRAE